MNAPDERWIPVLKMIFGLFLLFVLAGLVAIIALGKVEEKTSYTLSNMETGLLMLTSAWGQHMLSGRKDKSNKEEDK
jgi:hypothetical protein